MLVMELSNRPTVDLNATPSIAGAVVEDKEKEKDEKIK